MMGRLLRMREAALNTTERRETGPRPVVSGQCGTQTCDAHDAQQDGVGMGDLVRVVEESGRELVGHVDGFRGQAVSVRGKSGRWVGDRKLVEVIARG